MTRLIFVTGGVVSSLGKGLTAAALAALLQARGFKVRIRKLDPYLNIDPGTMSPSEHGEVFVTNDGAETDLDLGHYERFTGVCARKSDNVTTGQVYWEILNKERDGQYLGKTIQVIPHVTDAIKAFVMADLDNEDFLICEIGGTVGDIESLPFLEAIRQLGNELGTERSLLMHLTLVPHIRAAGELKTKPTQHSVKELQGHGLKPEIVICRTEVALAEKEKRKIEQFCSLKPGCVIEARDVDTIYALPLTLQQEGLDQQVLDHFGLDTPDPKLEPWHRVVTRAREPKGEVHIAIVGKYMAVQDSYKSLEEALTHGGIANGVRVKKEWIDAERFEREDPAQFLSGVHGILVPGGFGERGTEGKIQAAKFAREQGVPFFGICLGMQMAVVEAARNLAGLQGADSSEFGDTKDPVVFFLEQWIAQGGQIETRKQEGGLGGTMRLGAYEATLREDSQIAKIYGTSRVTERHRHRYEVNPAYLERLEAAGLRFAGMSVDGGLPETIEIEDHVWFIGVQYHPELKSRPLEPHPLFTSFITAACEESRLMPL